MVAEDTRPEIPGPEGAPAPLPPPAGRRFGRHDTLWRALAAAGSGLAQLFALPPYGLWFLAPLSAALLAFAVLGVRARRAAWLGLLSGAALMVPLLKWQEIFGNDVWLLIAAAEAAYFVFLAMASAAVLRLRGWTLWVPALWVAQEAVRSRFPLGGFPWGKLAFSQPDTPFAGYAAWGSSALVTFMVALSGTLLLAFALSFAPGRRTPRQPAGSPSAAGQSTGPPRGRLAGLLAHRPGPWALRAYCAAGVAAILAVGVAAPLLFAPQTDHRARVALVQGDVPGVGEVAIGGERMQVLQNHVDGVHTLADQVRSGEVERPDLVLLPENASDIDLYADPGAAKLVSDAAADIGVPLLMGTNRFSDGGRTREVRSVVWDPESGPGDHYTKRYLVPFGEYVPFRDVFAKLVARLDQVGSDAVPGTEPGALELNGTTIGTAICFDVAFDAPVRESVAAGGQIIAVPTNNANYNFTGQSDQQLAITRLRAVEHGRPAVVASTSGISAVVDPDGGVSYRSPEAEPAVHVAEVPAMTGLTPATRLGAAPELAITALGVAALITAITLHRRPNPQNPTP
ncbi:apolipoprotein N-acyltransferase [Murinocardiopsis flavida]|uniref:apolipoprotein N-acyltransferase n=1 Tax=Murinocardiopsis flavida TaxID=645275 RepID=UPI000D0CD129|nr:apolipoprotein N-acyltransferase [Murinocardiopsis flavida]